MRKHARVNRGLLLTFIATLALGLSYHLDLFGHVAYAFERGKLKADLDHLQAFDVADVVALEQLSHAFRVISAAVKPSVVNIESASKNEEVNRQLRKLFGEDVQPRPSTSTGTGIIFDEDGHIVTNNHVVEDSDSIHVTLSDGRRFRAETVGTDPRTDLAVIKIKAQRLHAAKMGDSDRVAVGDVVLAIGSPFRLDHSVSHGIISALGRSDVRVDIDYQNWLQTDAPINPGNSGGPLINARGEVIGVNTAIATESGGHQGVGFAIPSNTVKFIAGKLRSGKRFVRGFLGVGIGPVDPQIADAYGLEEPGGARITAVGPGTPAEKAGLEPEDIILAVGDTRVETREQLQAIIAATAPNTNVELDVWRNRRRVNLSLVVGAQPEGFRTNGSLRELERRRPTSNDDTADEQPKDEPAPTGPSQDSADSRQFEELGFESATVSPELAKRFDLEDDIQNGVVITWVDPTGEAYDAQLRPGYVIVRANDRRIRNVHQLEQVLTPDALANGIRLKLRDGNAEVYSVLHVR